MPGKSLCQNCVFCSCTLLTVLEQSNMCSVYAVVSPFLTVDKLLNSNKSLEIHYLPQMSILEKAGNKT